MLSAWAPILIFLMLVTGFALVSVIASLILGMRKPTPEKQAPYECGMQPVGTARERFSVKFYLVAMLFLEMVLFIAVVLAGYIYVWKKGALEWER
jgi:NADH-quinone oxidoreductase subunit A